MNKKIAEEEYSKANNKKVLGLLGIGLGLFLALTWHVFLGGLIALVCGLVWMNFSREALSWKEKI